MAETIDDTGFGGIRLIQETEGFRYGIDAVLLYDFASFYCPGARDIAELGCGNGIVSLLLCGQGQEGPADRHVTGIDFQAEAIGLADRSAALNGLTDRVRFLDQDIASIREDRPDLARSFDLVVSNPPYVARGSGIAGGGEARRRARQESTADLDAFIQTASWMLRGRGGSLCLVHRPSRLVDIMTSCRSHQLEPKRIRFVHPREGKPPNIVLLHCVMGAGRELIYDEPIFVYDAEGGYSRQILEIYGRDPKL